MYVIKIITIIIIYQWGPIIIKASPFESPKNWNVFPFFLYKNLFDDFSINEESIFNVIIFWLLLFEENNSLSFDISIPWIISFSLFIIEYFEFVIFFFIDFWSIYIFEFSVFIYFVNLFEIFQNLRLFNKLIWINKMWKLFYIYLCIK